MCFIESTTKLSVELAKLNSTSPSEIRRLIEAHCYTAPTGDSKTHRIVYVTGCGHVVPAPVAEELSSLRRQLRTLQDELKDRIRAS